jgi:hypothetical protein
MAVICNMVKHSRTPFRFKTVFEIYLDFRQRLVTKEGSGRLYVLQERAGEGSTQIEGVEAD